MTQPTVGRVVAIVDRVVHVHVATFAIRDANKVLGTRSHCGMQEVGGHLRRPSDHAAHDRKDAPRRPSRFNMGVAPKAVGPHPPQLALGHPRAGGEEARHAWLVQGRRLPFVEHLLMPPRAISPGRMNPVFASSRVTKTPSMPIDARRAGMDTPSTDTSSSPVGTSSSRRPDATSLGPAIFAAIAPAATRTASVIVVPVAVATSGSFDGRWSASITRRPGAFGGTLPASLCSRIARAMRRNGVASGGASPSAPKCALGLGGRTAAAAGASAEGRRTACDEPKEKAGGPCSTDARQCRLHAAPRLRHLPLNCTAFYESPAGPMRAFSTYAILVKRWDTLGVTGAASRSSR